RACLPAWLPPQLPPLCLPPNDVLIIRIWRAAVKPDDCRTLAAPRRPPWRSTSATRSMGHGAEPGGVASSATSASQCPLGLIASREMCASPSDARSAASRHAVSPRCSVYSFDPAAVMATPVDVHTT